jgi:hypothetical protein
VGPLASLARRFAVALRDAANFVPTAEKLADVAEADALGSQANVPPSPVVAEMPVDNRRG